jgi:hypothetical protein
MPVVFPGHGAAGAPSPLLAAQRDYLLSFAAHVKDLMGSGTILDSAARAELQSRMTRAYPEAGLTFLIGMSIDPITRELNGGGSVRAP